MSDRPMPTNGKRYRAWGTRELCPACGACLCFKCHPQGPCVEDRLMDRPEGLSRSELQAPVSVGSFVGG